MATATTKAPPLTTPFVFPKNCYMSEVVAFSAIGDNVSRNASVEYALYANPDRSAFAVCQPSGWKGDGTSSTFAFSPAVCPKSWVMYHMTMHKQVIEGTSTKTVTTGYCCSGREKIYPSGVPGLGIDYYSSNPVCLQSFASWQDVTLTGRLGGTGAEVTFTTGTAVQPAWRVAWEESDRPTLTPAPPSLKTGQSVLDWFPGEPLSTSGSGKICTSRDTCDRNDGAALGGILWAIVVPVVVVIALILAVWIWCVVHRSKKRKREAALRSQGETGMELKPQ
ncbi:uncharacterized protein CTRU02_213996 [Colletotrichum truncatum]|uniref:Uncharacterized protein n=1 Tax=Colletotrichum truncatum TaxID=5467 RepID=A0ACC3YHC4_COLTU